MNDNIKVSVILPVYNVESYIARCVDSLRTQTIEDLEFIFVDDRTPDGSMKIVESEAEKDPRIRILTNEENMGPGPSRNRGIEAARGEYLSFVDPDDYLAPDFYEILYKSAKEKDADIAKGHCVPVDDDDNIVTTVWTCENWLNNDLKKGSPLFYCFNNEHCTALFRRSLLTGDTRLRYAETRVGEDTIFLLRVCLKDPVFTMDVNAVYFRLIRSDSIIGSLSYENVCEGLKALENRVDVLCEALFPEGWIEYLRGSVGYYIDRFRRVYISDQDHRERAKRLHTFCEEMNRILDKTPDKEEITKDHKSFEELLRMENSTVEEVKNSPQSGSGKKKSLPARMKRKLKRLMRLR